MLRPTPTRARALRAAAFLLALALALPVHAQQKKASPRRTKRPAAVTVPAEPAPLEPVVTAPAPSMPAEPLPVVTAPRAFRGSSSFAIGAGLFNGSEIGKGFGLQIDYGMDRTPASWGRLRLEWRLAIMFAMPTEETPISRLEGLMYAPAGVATTSAYVVEIAPTARVRLPLGPKVGLFADAGVGAALSMETYERDEMYMGLTIEKENVAGLVVRAGLGLSYDATPTVHVLLLPVAGSLQIGPRYSSFQPMLAVAFGR